MPIQLQIENAKKEIRKQITDISNSNQIDYYFLFDILKELLLEIEPLKKQELLNLQNTQNELKKSQKESDK